MKLTEMILGSFWQRQLEQMRSAWHMQDRDERAARLRTVVALSVELERIKAISGFSTTMFRGAIEAVIEGDWRHVADFAEWCKFEGEGEECQARYAPLWEGYRAILLGAFEEARQRRAGVKSMKN